MGSIPVSIKHGLRTADCGLRTADCGLRTASHPVKGSNLPVLILIVYLNTLMKFAIF